MNKSFLSHTYLFIILVLFKLVSFAQVKDSMLIKQLIDSALKIEFSDNSLAQKIAQDALKLSEKNKFYNLNSKALVVLGYLYDDIGEFEKAKQYYNRSLAINLKNNYKKQIGLDYSNLGLNSENSGDLHQAISWHTKALELREEIKDTFGIAASNNNIGNIYGRQGDYAKSLNYFLKSLKIIEQIGNQTKLPPQLNNIAIIYFRLHSHEKAIDYYLRALKIWKDSGDKDGTAIGLYNLGNVYKEDKNYTKALEFYNEAATLNIQIENKAGIAECYNAIGSLYSTQKQYSKALDYFQKALKLKTEMNDKSDLATIHSNMGSLYIEVNQINQALSHLDIALLLAQENRLMGQLRDIYKYYYLAYKAKGNYNMSLKYHELYFAINDSVYNVESTKQLNELNTRYETDKKEKENKLLQTENALSIKTIKQQKLVTYFIIVGLILALTLAFFIFKGLKQQRKNNEIISAQKVEVEQQKSLIEEHQKEILDSIHYAKRIQYTLLAHHDFVNEHLPDNFILFKPKDIVSGDFYWATERDNKFYLAVCDSTGHGVPGAFMSLLNIGFLSEAINEKNIFEPNAVFSFVRERLINSISKEGQKDGFDGILICVDKTTNTVTYVAANNAPILISNNEIIELEKDRMPVGKGERKDEFNSYTVNFKTGDMLYLYTDGYADQFGGPKGKKFKYKQLNELLLSLHTEPMLHQKDKLQSIIEEWKGELEQVDDICVIGIKLS